MEQLLEESGKSRREAQETAVFCQVDNMMYSALPRAEFLYTQQIGRGGTMCDYTFRKRSPLSIDKPARRYCNYSIKKRGRQKRFTLNYSLAACW